MVLLCVAPLEESLVLRGDLIQFIDGKTIKPLISVGVCASDFLAENGFLMENNRE